MAMSLYIHIPFCIKRCIYCDFVSGIYSPDKEVTYMEALKKEIELLPKDISFKTLYIGGGTPTALSTASLEGLITHVFHSLNFAEIYEATIEANPGTVDNEKLLTLRSSGINRISIGVQSFIDSELKFLGRIHTAEQAREAIDLARAAGFKNVGIDLIYGIPGQREQSWEKTLEMTVSLKPEHISTYELTVEQGTELYKMLKVHPHPNPPPSRGRDYNRIPSFDEWTTNKIAFNQDSPSPGGRG